ncbi:hypothetical protein [Candidatus Absconditicoccus praedator]|uniref:hypothetical protein n=1 Tax=Candidatus Absconditicoccus praedator TaxID=2735562 RepID=UPI001E28C235|nr:hypothetical protein [Candidatus Absconditicoccus praedator]UFX83438.1 hypothetical protein HLG78_04895 [Candidatus Absconditicoccus praedator]
MSKLPTKLQTKKEDTETLINLLQDQKDNYGDEQLIFQAQPDLIDQLQYMKNEILKGAEDLDIKESETDTSRQELWKTLIDFVNRLKNYYKITTENSELPEWMYFKPQTNETGKEFLQNFFDKIEEELSQDFRDGFDEISNISIQEAKDSFEDWEKQQKGKDWDMYIEKRRNLSRLNNYIKMALMMTGMTRFEIRAYLYDEEEG